MESVENMLKINDGDRYWCNEKNKLHRTNGPAIEYCDGSKHWYTNGLRHRVGGPAIELNNGDKYWFIKGKCHRINGPSVEYANGLKEWFLNGVKYTKSQYKEKVENHENTPNNQRGRKRKKEK